MKPKKSKKLTLIELIIAVLILGLLTAIAMPQFVGTKANADVAAFKNDIDVLHKAVDEMYVREDKLPLGEKVTVTDTKLLDAVYASGDTGNDLYKIDLSQSKKYHDKLKTKVTNDDYFIYSLETGRIFYTNGMVDGDKKVHYTMEYIGISGLKLGSNTLVSGMNVPMASPTQTLTGSIPLTSTVEIKVNGTSVPVTYENVTFDAGRNIMAGVKMKTFASEVTLSEGKNVVTLKSGSTVTNFNIHLSDIPVTPEAPTGEPTTEPVTEPTTEAPIIKPVAIISMTPEQAITTTTNIVWGYENSTAADGRTIVAAEWEGKQNIYTTEGVYTVRLRVQDSTGVWSDWAEKKIIVVFINGIKQIETGQNHTFILKEDGSLWGAGFNNSGQLGDGTNIQRNLFKQVQSDVKKVSAGSNHTLLIKNDNSLWVSGNNTFGQLGTNNNISSWVFVKVMDNIVDIATGYYHSLILKEDGSVWSTGYNNKGQLGIGNTLNTNNFSQVTTNTKKVFAGNYNSFIIKNDDTLWGTGLNQNGQFGINNTVNRTSFVQIATDVIQMAAGNEHTALIKSDNTLWVSGGNYYGQLGNSSNNFSTKFIQVQTNVLSVIASEFNTFIIKQNEELWSTGRNDSNQLGTGNNTSRNSFVFVQSNTTNISSGNAHTIIAKVDGTIFSVGLNNRGQLGLGNTTNRQIFTKVNVQ